MGNIFKTRITWFLIMGVIFTLSCESEETEQFNNLIVSEDFDDGIFFVEYSEEGYHLRIDTNNPAVFMPCMDRVTIEIEPIGTADLTSAPGVYYVDYYFENSPDNILTLPLLITPYISMAKNTISLLKKMEKENEGYALVLRHSEARLGNDNVNSPIPEWWKSCDPNVARQMDEDGKRSSRVIGNAFKKLKIPIGTAVSSEFCRSTQTIDFMELGISYKTDRRLNHDNINFKSPMYEYVFDMIRESTHTEGILMLIGHGNISHRNPYRNYILPFERADGFLMRKKTDGELEFSGTVPFYFWLLFE